MIDASFTALDFGFKLEPSLRLNSSLPSCLQALIKQVPQQHARFDEMNEKLTLLYHENWQQLLAQPISTGSNNVTSNT